MKNDVIVAGIRKEREAHAARFSFDIDALYREYKRLQRKEKRKVVKYRAKRPSRLWARLSAMAEVRRG